MKTKSQFYSDFKYNPINTLNTYNNLLINDSFNINTENNTIKSCGFQSDLFKQLFNAEIAEDIKSNNFELLKSITKIIPYEYFNEINNCFENRIFALDESFSFYELDLNSHSLKNIYTFISNPKIIQSDDILYFFDEDNKCVLIENSNLLTVEELPKIKSFTTNSTKIYFTLENKSNILYASELCKLKDLSKNIEQYDSIKIPLEDGFIENVFCIKDKIFILTQYSIFKYDSENSSLIKQNDLNLYIYKHSSNLIDDNIIFYSSNGLYLFDGIDVKQIFSNHLKLSKNADFVYFNHNLYIFDSKFKNLLFRYNLTNNTFIKYKISNLTNFYTIKTSVIYTLVICYKNDNQNIISTLDNTLDQNQKLEQYVKFKPTFLNSNTLKQINNIYVNSTGNFQLKISSEISTVIFSISNEKQHLKLCLDGTFFNFEILSESDFELNSLLINYIEVGEWWSIIQ